MASSCKNIVLSFFAVFKDYVLIYFDTPPLPNIYIYILWVFKHFESCVILKHIGIVVLPIFLIYCLFIPINYTSLSLQFISTQKMLWGKTMLCITAPTAVEKDSIKHWTRLTLVFNNFKYIDCPILNLDHVQLAFDLLSKNGLISHTSYILCTSQENQIDYDFVYNMVKKIK